MGKVTSHKLQAISHKSKVLQTNRNVPVLFFSLFLAFYTLYAIRYTLLFAEDKIVAIVNQDIITQKDLNDFINFMRIQLSADYKGKELESKIQSMKLDLLNKLIEDRLILQEAKKANFNLNPERVKEKINEIKKHYSSDSEFQASLAKQGLVQADIEQKIKEQLLTYSIIDIQVRSKITIKPGEVTDFYQKNTGQFVSPEERGFESLTIDNEDTAKEILSQLRNGEELQVVADKYSLTIERYNCAKDGRLRKDIEDALFKIAVGQVSSPIKIEDNYYIFKLVSITPPRQLSLSEVQDRIQIELFNSRMREELAKWIEGLKKHSYIKISQF